MKLLKSVLPFVIFFLIISFFINNLFSAKAKILPTALIGEELPTFHLPSLTMENHFLSSTDLQGRVSLLNVWASWCYACTLEVDMLLKIRNQYHLPIYSINYKDDPTDAKNWLHKYGNPFINTGIDMNGDTAIDLGIYGTPETFLINKQGKIIYRHIGVIDQKSWEEVLQPLIQKLQNE